MPDLPVFVTLKATISDFQAKMAIVGGELEKLEKKHTNSSAVLAKAGGLAAAAIAGGAIAVGVASVKMAADFQTSMSKLVTSGGETQRNLAGDMTGVMKLMSSTGTSASQLAGGLYTINSAGFHGAQGLQVLKAAAQGAKTENADLVPVTDGLTTMLNDYGLSAKSAADVTSKMVAATSRGKTTFEDLAGSLHTVSPAAHTAGISMDEVLGAMATMTAKGTPAADSATYLRQTILQLSNPTAKAANEMEALGLSSIDVSKNLGERGLTGTLSLLTSAIESHMGPQGTVLIEKLKAASTNASTFQKVLANLPPTQQTYVGALADMVGGTKSMQAALELSNSETMPVFKANVEAIGKATADTKGNVEGWAIVQKNFNQKMSELRGSLEVVGIKLGMVLIPIIEKIAAATAKVVVWFEKHRAIAIALGIAVGSVLVTAMAAYAVVAIADAAATIAATWPILALLAAVAALGAGIYLLVTHFSEVVAFLRGPWGTAIVGAIAVMVPFIGIPALIILHWKEVENFFKGMWRDMKAWTLDAVNAIVGFFVRMGHDIKAWTLDAVNAVVGFFMRMGHDIKAWTLDAVNAVVGFFTKLPGRIVAGILSAWDAVQYFFTHVGAAILGWVGGALTDMFDFGWGLIKKLIAGMESMVGSLSDFIGGLAKKVINWFTHPWQIFSPSQKMFEAGQNLMLGLRKGIEAHTPGAADAARRAAGAISGALGGITVPGVAVGTVAGGNAAVAQQAAAFIGWTGSEWTALNNLVMRESGWSMTATNPSSGAYGIAQGITGPSWYYQWPGGNPNTLMGQLNGLFAYIKSRYGDPAAAWQHEMAVGWYDRGGILPPGLTLAMNTTGRNEYVVGGAGGSSGGTTIVLQVDGKTLGNVVLTELLREQQRRPLGIKTS